MAFCAECGTEVTSGSRFCANCGSLVSGESDSSDAPTEQIRRPSDDSIAIGEQRLLHLLRQVTLGEYEILGEIGRGGMAVVYLAHDIALDRKVAVKVMTPALTLMDPGIQERFKREARTAAGLSHPHIIPVYAVRESHDIVYFVMKYIAGRALDSVIQEVGQIPTAMVQTILTQVGAALGHAHRKGVVHRDVKPANIMLDEGGWVVVTDFGIAKVSEKQALTMTGGVIGTPAYMSPEQCAGQDITGAADQYSLGVTAFEMLTGRKPFESAASITLMYDHCHTPPPNIADLRPDCPSELATAVMRMLEKDPAKRFSTVEEAVATIGVVSDSQSGYVRTQILTLAQDGHAARILEKFQTPRSPASQRSKARPPAPTPDSAPIAARRISPSRPRGAKRLPLVSIAASAVVVVAGWFVLGNRSQSDEATATPLEESAATLPQAETPTPVALIAQPPRVAMLEAEPPSASLSVGETALLRAVARDANRGVLTGV
ncbi:MAG: protein kinase, partial [Gemmatimonadota bacterium]|nr:protein kinase [Gemmatimonadota bacterium]